MIVHVFIPYCHTGVLSLGLSVAIHPYLRGSDLGPNDILIRTSNIFCEKLIRANPTNCHSFFHLTRPINTPQHTKLGS